MRKDSKRKLWENWGYIALPILLWGWFVGLFAAPAVAALSTVTMGFFLFQAKAPCGAENREVDRKTGDYTLCRRDANGLLRGCSLKAHKWGNAKLMVTSSGWGRLVSCLAKDGAGRATAVGALANIAAVLVAIGALLVSLAK